jgi:hypothetical protein
MYTRVAAVDSSVARTWTFSENKIIEIKKFQWFWVILYVCSFENQFFFIFRHKELCLVQGWTNLVIRLTVKVCWSCVKLLKFWGCYYGTGSKNEQNKSTVLTKWPLHF